MNTIKCHDESYLHDEKNDEHDNARDERQEAKEEAFARSLAIYAPMSLRTVRVQRVVDVVRHGELLVQATLKHAVLL